MDIFRLENDCVSLGVTAVGGQLDGVTFHTADGPIRPMHTAPWVDEQHDEDVPPMLRMLRGDFFCAPFGDSDVLENESRPHGAPANDVWTLEERSETHVTCRLAKDVSGATVRKRIHLQPDHPVVYQEHVLAGGAGDIPIGHHAMLRAEEPLLLGFAPFHWAGTPPQTFEGDPERGRSLLKYPQTITDLSQTALAEGGHVDARVYPQFDRHEDLLMLVAQPELTFGWSTATAPQAGWVWFALKQASVLRNTVLWMSNGGRYYTPFSRRHTRVLGIEETTSCFHLGHRASIEPNPVQRQGHATAVTLVPDQPLTVRYAFGLTRVPAGFGRVVDIQPTADGVLLLDESDGTSHVSVDLSFIASG
jgi:hypothetical protein